jgi:FkbM family methyltransferase
MQLLKNMTFRFIYILNNSLSYLYKINIEKRKKIRIIFEFLKLSIKKALFESKKEKILGFIINTFNMNSLWFLFNEIFLKQEYYFESSKKNPLIIDCGANIGVATLYFKWLYPESKVYSFEADIETSKLLKKNAADNNLKDVFIFNNAVSNKDSAMSFFIDKHEKGSLHMSINRDRIKNAKEIKIKSIDFSEFIKNKKVDFLKMDIEGEEKNVFKKMDKDKTINNIKQMIIEYHHKINDEKSELSDFLIILEKNDFEYQIDCHIKPVGSKEKFQDILIHAYKK